jgi:hypothetical protein
MMMRKKTMRVSRLIGQGMAAALLIGSIAPALAQRQAEDVFKEAEMAARAKKEADALRAEADKTEVKPLVATIHVTPDNVWVLDLSDGGRVRILLRPDVAPGHVERVKALTRQGFYNGVVFHRVIDGFMAQSGDP